MARARFQRLPAATTRSACPAVAAKTQSTKKYRAPKLENLAGPHSLRPRVSPVGGMEGARLTAAERAPTSEVRRSLNGSTEELWSRSCPTRRPMISERGPCCRFPAGSFARTVSGPPVLRLPPAWNSTGDGDGRLSQYIPVVTHVRLSALPPIRHPSAPA